MKILPESRYWRVASGLVVTLICGFMLSCAPALDGQLAAAPSRAPSAEPLLTVTVPPTQEIVAAQRPSPTAQPSATAVPIITATRQGSPSATRPEAPASSTASRLTPPPPAAHGVPKSARGTCPAGFPIKGNQGSRSTSEWIYHVPGGGSYGQTDPEECFATEADAQAAGYRRARN